MTIATLDLTNFATVSDWLTTLQDQYKAWLDVGWDFISILRDGISQFGRSNDHAIAELYDLASQATGMSTKRLQNLVSMSRNEIAEIAQGYELDFGYAEAVLGLEPDVADDVLARAKATAASVSQVRKETWGLKQKSAIPASGNSSPAPQISPQTYSPPSDDPPFCDPIHYNDDWTPDALPDDICVLAGAINAKFSESEVKALVAELVRDIY